MVIRQTGVGADDTATPALKDIRERITTAIAATTGDTGLERLKCWLQMPATSTFGTMLDNDCAPRAAKVGALLSPAEEGAYEASNLAAVPKITEAWANIDKMLKADRAVVLKGPADHVGGAKSKFTTNFHVIVLLAVGKDDGDDGKGEGARGKGYYLGLDPDVSATDDSRAAWKKLVAGETETKPGDFTEKTSLDAIKAMILGDGESGFGPLVRKYYVDTTAVFPKIDRFGVLR